jgi:hypothetical protein
MLHGIDRYGNMQLPWCSDIYKVNILALAKLLIALIAAIYSRLGHTCRLEIALTRLGTLLILIAQRIYLYAIDICKSLHSTRASHAKTYKAYSHRVERLAAKLKDTLLPLATLWLVEDNHPIDNIIAYTRLIKWLILTSCHRAYR